MLALVSIAASGAPRFDGTDWETLVHTTGTYVLQSEIAPAPATAGRFGAATAMWHDDTTGVDWAVIGAPIEDTFSGAAYVYSLAPGATIWHAEQKLVASDASENSAFGFSVAIDGNTIAVGAPAHESDMFVGAAYVFVRDETWGVWKQQGDEFNGTGGEFGYAVAVRGDMLAVSEPGKDSVFTYARDSGAWSPFAKLALSSGVTARTFGQSLVMDDARLLIGAPTDSDIGHVQGSAALFSKSRDSWDLQQLLTPEIDTSTDQYFGTSVSMSADAIVIGSTSASTGRATVHVFTVDTTVAKFTEQSLIRSATVGSPPRLAPAIALAHDVLSVCDFGAAQCAVYRWKAGAFAGDSTLIGDAGSSFGFSVSATSDKILVGAIGAKADSDGDAFVFQSDRIFADGFD